MCVCAYMYKYYNCKMVERCNYNYDNLRVSFVNMSFRINLRGFNTNIQYKEIVAISVHAKNFSKKCIPWTSVTKKKKVIIVIPIENIVYYDEHIVLI